MSVNELIFLIFTFFWIDFIIKILSQIFSYHKNVTNFRDEK